MKIAVIGDAKRRDVLSSKLAGCELTFADTPLGLDQGAAFDIIFDIEADQHDEGLTLWPTLNAKVLVASAVRKQLADMARTRNFDDVALVGMNLLPGFIDRDIAEVSFLESSEIPAVRDLLQEIGWTLEVVDDRVGMVTPRLVFMIINEACYTMQEGTASMDDIDLGMKLGTNYPKGPLAWADEIGIQHVYEVLDALYRDTRDERYKICPLLKTKYLRNEPFRQPDA